MPLIIRNETPQDISIIHALTKAAFLHAPHTAHTEHFIVDALRKAGSLSFSLIAEEGDVIVGHIAASPVAISDGTTGWYGLGPLSVRPEHQRKGIGSKLMDAVLKRLKKNGASGCVLLGEPAYYGRFGFKAEAGLVYPGVPPEYFQVLSLDGSTPRGTVSYHEAFEVQE